MNIIMKTAIATLCALCASMQLNAQMLIPEQNPPARSHLDNQRVKWMQGKYGIMVHWIFYGYDSGIDKIDAITDKFDIDAFMRDFEATGASWLIFTIGQNSGAYASPNANLEKYCGKGHSSKRDLVLEIAKAVHAKGKKFIAYVPCEVRDNKSMKEGLKWTASDNFAEFQKRYVWVLREWSMRYGKYCDGWWIDGCIEDIAPRMNWDMWHRALRAGNPDAVITFNPGMRNYLVLHPDHDYTAGETDVLLDGRIRTSHANADSKTFLPNSDYYNITKTLWHILFPMDSNWGAYSNWSDYNNPPWICYDARKNHKIHPPVYSKKNFHKFLDHMRNVRAAVTVNMGITEEGRLSAESIELFKK